MIVKNEAQNLDPCIQPLKSVLDEIVIIDTGSTDSTQEVAKRLGAKVFDFPWCDDFSAARNESIRHATGDYILWLDADDRIASEDVKKIGQLKAAFPKAKDEAYFLMVSNLSLVDGETLFQQLRIFPRRKGAFFEGRIHEQIHHRLQSLGIKMIHTDIRICHQGYHAPEEVAQKSLRNLRIIERALEADPDNLFLHFQAARTLAGISRFKSAVEHMRKVVDHPQTREKERHFFFDATLLMAQWCMEIEDFEEALCLLNRLEEWNHKDSLIHFYRGDLFYRMGNFDGAIREMAFFLQGSYQVGLIPVNADWLRHYPYYVLWLSYLKKGEPDLANKMLSQFMSQPRTHTKCLEELGRRCLQKGQFDEAAILYQRAIEEGSVSDTTYTNLGLALWKAGQVENGKAAFEKALAFNPMRLEALTNLGHLYHQQKEDLRARDCFHRALSLKPDLIDVRLVLSEIFFRSLDPDGLAEQCNELLKCLDLPRHFIVESLDEMSDLYEQMGKSLLERGQGPLALMAFYLCFLLNPTPSRLKRLVEEATGQGRLEWAFGKIEEGLSFHGIPFTREEETQRLLDVIASDA